MDRAGHVHRAGSVLVNDEGQHSLWPAAIQPAPEGWVVAHAEDARQACLDYVNEHWTDMRPKSLIREMEGEASSVPGPA